jgi:hypothetical protein
MTAPEIRRRASQQKPQSAGNLPSGLAEARRGSIMHRSFAALAIFLTLLVLCGVPAAHANDSYRITGPFAHDNLAVYFLHGASAAGAVPLTLAEALAAKKVIVHETSSVNELAVENLSDEEVFIQSGDIVKGGRQDRALTASLMLPPRSGLVPIAAFCVEAGRWTRRGDEDAQKFTSAESSVPSQVARTEFMLSSVPLVGLMMEGSARDRLAAMSRQQRVWTEVAGVQKKLSDGIGAPVAAKKSQTSLQLALENEKLKQAQNAYVGALEPAGEGEADIIGYAFTVNGKLRSIDVFPSNALFRKMWAKLLTAHATEAIADKGGAAGTPPTPEAVAAFVAQAEGGEAVKSAPAKFVGIEGRVSEQAIYLESRRADGSFVHRRYLAK